MERDRKQDRHMGSGSDDHLLQGSNQHQKRYGAPSPTDQARLADQMQRMQGRVPVTLASSALAGDASSRRPTATLMSELNSSIAQAIHSEEEPTPDSIRRNGLAVARSEDAVLQKHPDLYGHYLMEAAWWDQTSQAPSERARIEDPEAGVGRQLAEDYSALQADAAGDRQLPAEELAQTLARITSGRAAWDAHSNETPKDTSVDLAHHYAALSTVCSRSSSDPKNAIQLEEVRKQLNQDRVADMRL